MKYHRSFFREKKKKAHDLAVKMNEAKRRGMLEAPAPDYPLDRNELCYRHAVIFSEIGKPVKRVYELKKIEGVRIRYWLYVDGKMKGQITHRQLLKMIDRDFPRIGQAE
jgi:hypothetical protein